MNVFSRNRRGASLLELLMGVAIFSVALLGILDIVNRIEHSIAISNQYRKAYALAESQTELLRHADLDTMAGEEKLPFMKEVGSLEGLPEAEGSFGVVKEEAGYRISVEIRWGTDRRPHRYDLHTLISNRVQS